MATKSALDMETMLFYVHQKRSDDVMLGLRKVERGDLYILPQC